MTHKDSVRLVKATVLCGFLLAPAAARADVTRTLGTHANSGFGQDTDASNWLAYSATTTSQGVNASVMAICTSVDLNSGCSSNSYEILVQIPFAPDDLSVTVGNLSGFDGNSFGIEGCGTSSPLQTSIAICTPNPPGDITVNTAGPADHSSLTLTFGGVPLSYFPAAGLTLYLDETNPACPPTSQDCLPAVTVVSGHAGVGLSQSSLAFGSQSAPATAANTVAQTVILTNGGLVPLNVTAVAATGDFAAASDCTGASPLAPNAACSISVIFTPTGGPPTGTLTITDDAPSSGQKTVALSGYEETAPVSLAPSTLIFGSQPVPTGDMNSIPPSAEQSVVLTNNGSTDLTLASIGLLTGTDFALEPDSTCSTTSPVAANGGTCQVNVSSIATIQGPLSDAVVIKDGNGATHYAALTGFGTSPEVAFDLPNLSFGAPTLGTQSSLVSTLTGSLQSGQLTIGCVATGAAFSLSSPPACTDLVVANPSLTFNVSFTPAVPGLQTAPLAIANGIGNGSDVVALSGTGVGPAVTLSPAVLNFPGTSLNVSSAALTLTLTNTGNDVLNIGALTATANFAIDPGTTTCSPGVPVAAGGSCAIGVTFTPTAEGSASGTLTIADDALPVTQNAALSGTGLAPEVVVSPLSLTFSAQILHTKSAAQSVTVSNNGNAALSVSGVAIGGIDAADFSETDTCSTPVDPGQSCSVSVSFTPSATGSRSATLTVTDNSDDNAGSTQTVTLTGTGTEPEATLSVSKLTFPSENVGTASPAQTETITNTGTAALTISGIAIGGANASDFPESSTCGGTLAAGANCAVTVTFKPTNINSRTATLTVTDDASDSPQTAALSGTGLGPAATLSPASLSFSAELVGGTSAAQPLTVTNGGNTDLSFSKISASGDFGVAANGTTCSTSAALASGKTCVVEVTFTPTAGGSRTGTLTLDDNAVGSSSQTASLTGTGEDFDLGAAQGGTSATVTAGQTATYSLTLTPEGGFSQQISLACVFQAPQPVGTACSVSPPSLTPSGSSAATVTVTASTRAGLPPPPRPHRPGQPGWYAVFVAVALGLLARSRASARRRRPAVLAAVALAVALAAACGGGSSGGPPSMPAPTPNGQYHLTLTATAGSLSHSVDLTLTVN